MGRFFLFRPAEPPRSVPGLVSAVRPLYCGRRHAFGVFGLGLGWFLRFLSCRPPPLSTGAGLGNQAALLWPRTRFLRFWAGFGMVPGFFVLPTSPRSVPGRGLSNPAAKLWHRTVGFSCPFLLRPADPPPIGAGGDLGIFATPTVAQDCAAFCLPFSVV